MKTHLTLGALALVLSPAAALAHDGHAAGFLGGILHPLTGADHLLAMLAVGLWAGALGGRAVLALPAAFVGALASGAALGTAGLALPMVEPGILASVIILGALAALALRLPLSAARRLSALPLMMRAGRLVVAMQDVSRLAVLEQLAELSQDRVN